MTMIPLSRSHLYTAWPIAAFNAMSKPSDTGCNLACEYCNQLCPGLRLFYDHAGSRLTQYGHQLRHPA